MWEQLRRIIKPNGAIVLFGSEPFSSILRCSNIKDYKYDWVWQKQQGTGHLNSKIQPLRCTENLVYFIKNNVNIYRKWMAAKKEQLKEMEKNHLTKFMEVI
jgi:site-specific DNA-methyltransferase (adenine-specific)